MRQELLSTSSHEVLALHIERPVKSYGLTVWRTAISDLKPAIYWNGLRLR